MKSKKIYLVITPFFPHEKHFAGSYIYDQVVALKKNSDYDVKVIKVVPFYKDSEKSYTYQGIKCHNFKVIDFPSSILPGVFHKMNYERFKKFLTQDIKININDIAFIHSHVIYPAGFLGVSLGKEFKIKNFIQHHGLDVLQKDNGRILKGFLRKLNTKYMENKFIKVINQTDLNIGVSQKVIDELKKIENFSNPNIYILYNGVDPNKFFKIDNFEKNNKFTIGCIGNFWPLKDQITLLKALYLLVNKYNIEDIVVKFIGSGVTLDECKKYVRENHLENFVEFHSEIDHRELNKFYNSLDLFALPSYYEALGCVYMEALKVGVPIIGVKNQGIEEVIDKNDRDLFLIQKKDYEDLSLKILNIYNNRVKPKTEIDIDINYLIQRFLRFIHD